MEPRPPLPSRPEDEPPPIFRTWSQVYFAVLVYLAFLLFTLYLVTRAFTY
jgi:Tfp pilus assembly protein PilN